MYRDTSDSIQFSESVNSWLQSRAHRTCEQQRVCFLSFKELNVFQGQMVEKAEIVNSRPPSLIDHLIFFFFFQRSAHLTQLKDGCSD